MGPLGMHAYKIQTIKKHKRQKFVSNVLLYFLSTLACTLFCSGPIWYPPFSATFNVIFFVSVPRIISFLFSSKVLFVVGNFIVIFLLGEWKLFTSWSKASGASYFDIYYDMYKCKISDREVFARSSHKAIKAYDEVISYEENSLKSNGGDPEEKVVDLDVVNLSSYELKKLADDFIARIHTQRRLEEA